MAPGITYGLGSENENLPGFMPCAPALPVSDVSNWRAGFSCRAFTRARTSTRKKTKPEELIDNIVNARIPRAAQRRQLDFAGAIQRRASTRARDDPQLEARIQSFELAYRMQLEATDAFDISKEPAGIREMYGHTVQSAQLLSRRLDRAGGPSGRTFSRMPAGFFGNIESVQCLQLHSIREFERTGCGPQAAGRPRARVDARR